VHSEVMVAEALSLLEQQQPSSSSSSAGTGSDEGPIHELLSTLGPESKLGTAEVPIQRIEDEVRKSQMAIDRLHARYYTQKPLEQAQEDASALKVAGNRNPN